MMACMRRAQQRLAGQVHHTMVATVGAEEPVVEHVVSSYRQRFGEVQQDRPRPDPGFLELGLLGLGAIEDEDSPPQPSRRPPSVPEGDEENFGDRHYLR